MQLTGVPSVPPLYLMSSMCLGCSFLLHLSRNFSIHIKLLSAFGLPLSLLQSWATSKYFHSRRRYHATLVAPHIFAPACPIFLNCCKEHYFSAHTLLYIRNNSVVDDFVANLPRSRSVFQFQYERVGRRKCAHVLQGGLGKEEKIMILEKG